MGNRILDIGISGLQAAQNQLLTTSHNISNANTPGYKRQEVILNTNIAQHFSGGYVGSGVHSTTVQRIYNQFLESQMLQVQAQSTSLDSNYTQIKQLDNMFAEDTSGLSPTLQKFFSAIQAVANNPSSVPARQSMISSAEAMVARFHSMEQRMSEVSDGVNAQIEGGVNEINSLSSQVADLNRQILLAEASASGQPANDLQDQRDELISQMSKLINTDIVRRQDGSVDVFVGNGQGLVVGSQTQKLQATRSVDNPQNMTISILTGGKTVELPEDQIAGGALGGILSFRNETLGNAQNALGRIAITLAQTFNEQHQLGIDLNGDMGEDFFSVATPKITSALTNDMASGITVAITDYRALTTSDYQFSYDGTNYTLTRLSDNQSISSTVLPSAGTPLTLDGISVDSATILANEKFLVQPTVNGAADLEVEITDATKIAAASPNRTSAALSNKGTGAISPGAVEPLPLDANLQQPLTITFHSPYDGQFDVAGTGTGLPATNQAFTAGEDISFNGFTFQINGSPAAGDIFTITPNANGAADNRNALLLGNLQTTNILDNGLTTYQSAYGQLVSQIGNKTRELDVTNRAQANLLQQTQNSIESISGVNLDEEAANLLRYQQAFQASSKVIEISNTLFDSILRI